MKKVFLICIFLIAALPLLAVDFEELDKPPEGAHEGQQFVGGMIFIGGAFSPLVDSEVAFLDGSTYTFDENGVTKEVLLSHLSFGFGLFYEYMPFDSFGARARINRNVLIQRTRFGGEFKNWSETLYSDWSLLVGPTYHLTTRKQWDVVVIPMIGYSFSTTQVTPVAPNLLSGYSAPSEESGGGLAVALELNYTAYFSGGMLISLGAEWMMNMTGISAPASTNPLTGVTYNLAGSPSIHHLRFVISAGYAFDN